MSAFANNFGSTMLVLMIWEAGSWFICWVKGKRIRMAYDTATNFLLALIIAILHLAFPHPTLLGYIFIVIAAIPIYCLIMSGLRALGAKP